MLTAFVIVFVIGHAAIALEHPLKINKSVSALLGAGLLWAIYAMSVSDSHVLSEQLGESLMSTAQIMFFLMGAVMIVEVVDAHNGFEVITRQIKTTKLSSLMWLVGRRCSRVRRNAVWLSVVQPGVLSGSPGCFTRGGFPLPLYCKAKSDLGRQPPPLFFMRG